MIDYSQSPISKGTPRKLAKGRKDRAEAKVEKRVRAEVETRDGHCRFSQSNVMAAVCNGPSEWAHFGDKKRFKTRGMVPDARHTTAGSLMLCRKHHSEYDAGRLAIEALTASGCDGLLSFKRAA